MTLKFTAAKPDKQFDEPRISTVTNFIHKSQMARGKATYALYKSQYKKQNFNCNKTDYWHKTAILPVKGWENSGSNCVNVKNQKVGQTIQTADV